MSSVQRTRAPRKAIVLRCETQVDHRGNKTVQPTMENPHEVRASEVPDRSSRAEVPGEMEINVISLRIPFKLEGVGLRSRVFWDGHWWDLVAPPTDHLGTRHSRHTTILIRKRPGGGDIFDYPENPGG